MFATTASAISEVMSEGIQLASIKEGTQQSSLDPGSVLSTPTASPGKVPSETAGLTYNTNARAEAIS